MGSSCRLRHLLGCFRNEAGQVHTFVGLLLVLFITVRQARTHFVLVLPYGAPFPLDTEEVRLISEVLRVGVAISISV